MQVLALMETSAKRLRGKLAARGSPKKMNEGDLVWWVNDYELYVLLYKGIAMARIYCIRTQKTTQVFVSDIRKADLQNK